MFLSVDYTFIIIIALLAVVGGLIGVFVAFGVMKRNRKRYEEAPEKQTRGEVTKLIIRERYTNITGLNTDPELEEWHYRKGNYLVQVLRDDGVFMLLSCDEKPYKKLAPGYYGQFTYKANILLDFRRHKSHELERQRMKEDAPYFFKNRETKGKTLQFFVEAPSFQLKISADKPLSCNLDEVKEYARHMLENSGENNFGLIDHVITIQFFNNGKEDKIWIDLIDPKVTGVYQASIERFDDLYGLIEAFFAGKNIRDLIEFEYTELK